jgi:hypothetical protein
MPTPPSVEKGKRGIDSEGESATDVTTVLSVKKKKKTKNNK